MWLRVSGPLLRYVYLHRRSMARLGEIFWVCPTFYTRSGPVIGEPCSIKSAMSSERYLIA